MSKKSNGVKKFPKQGTSRLGYNMYFDLQKVLGAWIRYGVLLSVLWLLQSCTEDPNPIDDSPTFFDDPREASLVTSDIDLFWEVFDANNPNFSSTLFHDSYFNAGSDGLRLYFEQKIMDADKMSNLLGSPAHKSYMLSVRQNTQGVSTEQETYYSAMEQLKGLYTSAVFSDVVFVIGPLQTGGTVVRNGQLVIGTELFSKSETSDISTFSEWHKAVIRDQAYLPSIVIHELVHTQQLYYANENGLPYGQEGTLLDISLLEGIADFITHQAIGSYINDHLPEYADPIEQELWEEFEMAMNGKDFSRWLFNGGNSTFRPADLGYYMGFKIAESYYLNAVDKSQAISEIIEMSNSQQFLEDSGYRDKFE